MWLTAFTTNVIRYSSSFLFLSIFFFIFNILFLFFIGSWAAS